MNKNPCKNCVVRAGCTKICMDKKIFIDDSLINLTEFVDQDTCKNLTPTAKKLLLKAHIRLSEICRENNNDGKRILFRGL